MTKDTTDIKDSTNEQESQPLTMQGNGNNAPPSGSRKENYQDCKNQVHVQVLDAIFTPLSGVIMHIADMVTDLLMGVHYFHSDYIFWGILTFIFVLIPSLVLQFLSFRWFVSDLEEDSDHHKNNGWAGKLLCWCDLVATHVLQLGVLKRYWRNMKFGLLSHKKKKYHELMIYENRNITVLRLLQAFMESAPQLVIQVYMMVDVEELYWLAGASVLFSLWSLAQALEEYYEVKRDACPNRKSITFPAMQLRVAWRLFMITSRVIAIVLFAAIYEWWVFVVVGVHWLVIMVWLVWQKTSSCDIKFEEVLFDCVIGFIHIFCFFNVKKGATRYRALFFYTVIFVENTVMFGLWYSNQDSREQIYSIPALVFIWGGFFVGIFLMAFYGLLQWAAALLRLTHPWYSERPDAEPSDEINGGNDPKTALNDHIPQMSVFEPHPCRDNLFSYKDRRHIYSDLLPWPRCKIECSIDLKPPCSTPVPTPKTQPETTDTYAVRRENGRVTTERGRISEDTSV
ncbi:XK-related protein 6-like [Diadema antillarum]|uniref:XK-related protein 6-like n=1 Tax=Diadema antillarum TaxID=105358 RepID=UPI003A85A248